MLMRLVPTFSNGEHKDRLGLGWELNASFRAEPSLHFLKAYSKLGFLRLKVRVSER